MSKVFTPHRVQGLVSGDVAGVVQTRGTNHFVTTCLHKSFHTYNVSNSQNIQCYINCNRECSFDVWWELNFVAIKQWNDFCLQNYSLCSFLVIIAYTHSVSWSLVLPPLIVMLRLLYSLYQDPQSLLKLPVLSQPPLSLPQPLFF